MRLVCVVATLVGCAAHPQPPATRVTDQPGVVIAPQGVRARAQLRRDDYIAAIPQGTTLVDDGTYLHWTRAGVKRGWIREIRIDTANHENALEHRQRLFDAAVKTAHAARVLDEERGSVIWSRRIVGTDHTRERMLLGIRNRGTRATVSAVVVRCFAQVPADECDAFANGVTLDPAFASYDPQKLALRGPETPAAPTPSGPTVLPPPPTTPAAPAPSAPARSHDDDTRAAMDIYFRTANENGRRAVLSPTCQETRDGRARPVVFRIAKGKKVALAAFVHDDAGKVTATLSLGSSAVPFDAPTHVGGVAMLFLSRAVEANESVAILQIEHASKQPHLACFTVGEWQ